MFLSDAITQGNGLPVGIDAGHHFFQILVIYLVERILGDRLDVYIHSVIPKKGVLTGIVFHLQFFPGITKVITTQVRQLYIHTSGIGYPQFPFFR